MNGRTVLTKTQNYSGAPEEHLCYIVSQGFHLTNKHSYLAFIMDPKFHCDHCGRQAACATNLCVPLELEQRRSRKEVIRTDHEIMLKNDGR